MRSFPQLEVLDVCLESTYFAKLLLRTASEDAEGQTNRNKLYQNHECEAVRKFSKAHGFDNLVQIHGLQRVNVKSSWNMNNEYWEAVDGFEAFLRRILTLPKDPSVS